MRCSSRASTSHSHSSRSDSYNQRILLGPLIIGMEKSMVSLLDRLRDLRIEPLRTSTFQPVTQKEIKSIESMINAVLPSMYSTVIMTFGNSLLPGLVNCRSKENPLYFSTIYGYEDIVAAFRDYKEVLPETLLPIG